MQKLYCRNTGAIGWNKLRILVTNRCNYCCPFCHNEGQAKERPIKMMSAKAFKQLINYLDGQDLCEINFSGGEPFLHKEIVDMIVYANDHMTCDISCATNLSLITDEQIARLAETRVKFNIQFPFVSEKDFAKSTGTGNLDDVLDKIKAVKSAGIKIGLNTVIQSANQDAIEQMVMFALENQLPLKFLPQMGAKGSDQFINDVLPILKKYAVEYVDKGTGALRWKIRNGSHLTSVLYIDSPCFNRNIKTCREYGEVRIHPDFILQCCIKKDTNERLYLERGKEFVVNQLVRLWNDFNHC